MSNYFFEKWGILYYNGVIKKGRTTINEEDTFDRHRWYNCLSGKGLRLYKKTYKGVIIESFGRKQCTVDAYKNNLITGTLDFSLRVSAQNQSGAQEHMLLIDFGRRCQKKRQSR